MADTSPGCSLLDYETADRQILQKGDEFRDPDRPGKTLRYVTEFLRGTPDPGAGRPQLDWVREGT